MRSVGQKQGRVPRRIAESIPARHAVACRLTGSRILSIARATPSVLADRPAAFLRRPSLHCRLPSPIRSFTHLHRPAAFLRAFFLHTTLLSPATVNLALPSCSFLANPRSKRGPSSSRKHPPPQRTPHHHRAHRSRDRATAHAVIVHRARQRTATSPPLARKQSHGNLRASRYPCRVSRRISVKAPIHRSGPAAMSRVMMRILVGSVSSDGRHGQRVVVLSL
jgi:hypothetical protein